ncbi:hypothetical protein MMC22_011624 [Lobaria immixta]|nr:hypothetical protein [Lobaria immixta]
MNCASRKRPERPETPSSSDPKRLRVEDSRPQEVEVDDSHPPISDYESLPPPAQLWAAFGDTASASFMHSQLNIEQYGLAVTLFHARLGLIVRGLSPDQLLAISLVTNPDFAATADKSDKERLLDLFEIAAAWTEDQIIRKMKQYATMWYKTPASLKYAEDYQYARRKKNATKFPFPELPVSAKAMLEISQPEGPPLTGLNFGKANVVDFGPLNWPPSRPKR